MIGLPGNPVSALVTFELFVRPLLRGDAGARPAMGGCTSRPASTRRVPKDRERRAYLRVVVRSRGRWLGGRRPAGGQSSAQLRALAAANALLAVPEGEPAGEAGARYDATLLRRDRVKPSHLGADGAPQMVDVGEQADHRSARGGGRHGPHAARRAADADRRRRAEGRCLRRRAPGGDRCRQADRGADPALPPDPARPRRGRPERATARRALVTIRAEARATARTGVEMEALTAASVAALTLYDMAKALQRDIVIERVELLVQGGRPERRPGRGMRSRGRSSPPRTRRRSITCSTRAAAGEREDTSGPARRRRAARRRLRRRARADRAPRRRGSASPPPSSALADAGARLIVTSGGTGLTPGDRTPAATRRVIDREVPGLAELMRAAGPRLDPDGRAVARRGRRRAGRR